MNDRFFFPGIGCNARPRRSARNCPDPGALTSAGQPSYQGSRRGSAANLLSFPFRVALTLKLIRHTERGEVVP